MCISFCRGRMHLPTIGLLALMLIAGALQAAPITISLVPANSTVELNVLNDPLIVDIQVSNPDQLSIKSWSLDLAFDPGVFDPIANVGTVPAQGFELGSYIPGVSAIWNPDHESDGIAPDVARGGVLSFPGAGLGSDATGLLARIALDAIGLSAASDLSLSGEVILDGGASATNVVFGSTQIEVTPEPATGALLLAGLAFYRRRRR